MHRPRSQVVNVRVQRGGAALLIRGRQDAARDVDRDRITRLLEHRRRGCEARVLQPTIAVRLVEVGLDEVSAALAHDRVALDRHGVAGRVGEHENPFHEERAVVAAEEAHHFLDGSALRHRRVDEIAGEARQLARVGGGNGGCSETVEPQPVFVHSALRREVVEADIHPAIRAGLRRDAPELRARVDPVLVVAHQHAVTADGAEGGASVQGPAADHRKGDAGENGNLAPVPSRACGCANGR
jgi:hypothetical protein